MIIRHAVRQEDIGHLRHAVDRLILAFTGAGQNNYSRGMIYFRWLLSDGAADAEQQRAVLATGVLNPSGKPGKADDLIERSRRAGESCPRRGGEGRKEVLSPLMGIAINHVGLVAGIRMRTKMRYPIPRSLVRVDVG